MHALYLRTLFHLFEDVKNRFSRENVKKTLHFREMTKVILFFIHPSISCSWFECHVRHKKSFENTYLHETLLSQVIVKCHEFPFYLSSVKKGEEHT